jgi:hypothetical protein
MSGFNIAGKAGSLLPAAKLGNGAHGVTRPAEFQMIAKWTRFLHHSGANKRKDP